MQNVHLAMRLSLKKRLSFIVVLLKTSCNI